MITIPSPPRSLSERVDLSEGPMYGGDYQARGYPPLAPPPEFTLPLLDDNYDSTESTEEDDAPPPLPPPAAVIQSAVHASDNDDGECPNRSDEDLVHVNDHCPAQVHDQLAKPCPITQDRDPIKIKIKMPSLLKRHLAIYDDENEQEPDVTYETNKAKVDDQKSSIKATEITEEFDKQIEDEPEKIEEEMNEIEKEPDKIEEESDKSGEESDKIEEESDKSVEELDKSEEVSNKTEEESDKIEDESDKTEEESDEIEGKPDNIEKVKFTEEWGRSSKSKESPECLDLELENNMDSVENIATPPIQVDSSPRSESSPDRDRDTSEKENDGLGNEKECSDWEKDSVKEDDDSVSDENIETPPIHVDSSPRSESSPDRVRDTPEKENDGLANEKESLDWEKDSVKDDDCVSDENIETPPIQVDSSPRSESSSDRDRDTPEKENDGLGNENECSDWEKDSVKEYDDSDHPLTNGRQSSSDKGSVSVDNLTESISEAEDSRSYTPCLDERPEGAEGAEGGSPRGPGGGLPGTELISEEEGHELSCDEEKEKPVENRKEKGKEYISFKKLSKNTKKRNYRDRKKDKKKRSRSRSDSCSRRHIKRQEKKRGLKDTVERESSAPEVARSLSQGRKHSPSPVRRRSVSRRRSITHRRSRTPPRRYISPRRRFISRRRRSISPRRRSISPRRRSISPRRRSISPRRRSISPPQRRSLSRKRSISRRRSLSRNKTMSRHRSVWHVRSASRLRRITPPLSPSPPRRLLEAKQKRLEGSPRRRAEPSPPRRRKRDAEPEKLDKAEKPKLKSKKKKRNLDENEKYKEKKKRKRDENEKDKEIQKRRMKSKSPKRKSPKRKKRKKEQTPDVELSPWESPRTPPASSKEVFTSVNNNLVSVSFQEQEEMRRCSTEPEPDQPAPVATAKPVAIIDLALSPFRQLTPERNDVIVLSDSEPNDTPATAAPRESCDRVGPKTPPQEPAMEPAPQPEPVAHSPKTYNPFELTRSSCNSPAPDPQQEEEDQSDRVLMTLETAQKTNMSADEVLDQGPLTPIDKVMALLLSTRDVSPEAPPAPPDAPHVTLPSPSRETPRPSPPKLFLSKPSPIKSTPIKPIQATKIPSLPLPTKPLRRQGSELGEGGDSPYSPGSSHFGDLFSPSSLGNERSPNNTLIGSGKSRRRDKSHSKAYTHWKKDSPYSPGSGDFGDLLCSPALGRGGAYKHRKKDSPYSPGSGDFGDLLSSPALGSGGAYKHRKEDSPYSPGSDDFGDLLSSPALGSGGAYKHRKKGNKMTVGVKLDYDNLKILEELPSSAFEMQVKSKGETESSGVEWSHEIDTAEEMAQVLTIESKRLSGIERIHELNTAEEMAQGKRLSGGIARFHEIDTAEEMAQFLKKLNRQERVVEEVKLVLKPHYNKKRVSKDEYKDILRRAVPKICRKSGEINPAKIQALVEAYVRKIRKKHKLGLA